MTGETLQLDALRTERNLRRRLSEFAQSVAYLRDPHISRVCRRLWESDETKGGLVGQLRFVNGRFIGGRCVGGRCVGGRVVLARR